MRARTMQDEQIRELLMRLEQARKNLTSSRGHLVFDRLGALRGSFLVFEGNHQQLVSALEKFRDPAFYLPTLDVQHREELDDFLLEVTRLLHNYVAAALTLADHTRVVANELYVLSPFLGEYQERVTQTFSELPVARFIQGLRTYMLHYRLPFPISHFNAMRNTTSDDWTFRTHLSLTVTELKRWSEWHPRAIEYLDAAGAQVDLDQVTAAYTSTVVDFHNWLRTRQQEIHQSDFDELARRLNAVHAVEAELGRGELT